MDRRALRVTGIAVLFTLALTGISCSRDKGAPKGNANLTPEQSRKVEAYKKSIQESKKIMVAKVNGVDILMSDLVKEMNDVAPEYIKPGQKRDAQTDQKVRKEAMDRLIYRELAVQEAVRQGMKVTSQEVADGLKRIKANLKSEEAYKANLAASGLTEEDLKKQIERGLLVEMITEKEIFGRVKIDPELVKKTYEKKKASYRKPSGQPMSFEEARPLIERELMSPAVARREDEWVSQLKKAARIEIALDKSAGGIHPIN